MTPDVSYVAHIWTGQLPLRETSTPSKASLTHQTLTLQSLRSVVLAGFATRGGMKIAATFPSDDPRPLSRDVHAAGRPV